MGEDVEGAAAALPFSVGDEGRFDIVSGIEDEGGGRCDARGILGMQGIFVSQDE